MNVLSPCNPSLYNNMIARPPLPRRHFSFSMLRTVQVRLARLQTALCGPLLDVLKVRHAFFCHHDHCPFGDTLERLSITSGAISYALNNRDIQCRLLHPCYISRAQDTGLLISTAYDQQLCDLTRVQLLAPLGLTCTREPTCLDKVYKLVYGAWSEFGMCVR